MSILLKNNEKDDEKLKKVIKKTSKKTTSNQVRLPAEFKHINKRRKRK